VRIAACTNKRGSLCIWSGGREKGGGGLGIAISSEGYQCAVGLAQPERTAACSG